VRPSLRGVRLRLAAGVGRWHGEGTAGRFPMESASMRYCLPVFFLLFLCHVLFFFTTSGAAQGSPGTPAAVPPEMQCTAECPGIGVNAPRAGLTGSLVSNACGGSTATVVYQGIQLTTSSQGKSCPTFIDYTPSCGRTIGKPGCCIIEMTDRPVLRQELSCECQSRLFGFLFCMRWECSSSGLPYPIDVLDSCATAAACPGGGASSDCHKDLP